MYDYFVTINTTDWQNSPYVPKSNAKLSNELNAYGDISPCWFVDSRVGKWSTLLYIMPSVYIGETALLSFWVKFSNKRTGTFMVEICQRNWEERSTFPLLKKCPYLVGYRGDYLLYSVPYTASEEHDLGFTISSNNIELTIFPATESDLDQSDITIFDSESMGDGEDHQIISCFKQNFPKTRFVGMRYSDSDKDFGGGFDRYWGQWFEEGRFDILSQSLTEDFKWEYSDAEAYVGLTRFAGDKISEYWIGMFLPEATEVPDGFSYIDFDYFNAGICYVKGKSEALHGNEQECYNKLIKSGMSVNKDNVEGYWLIERYACPRFTTPDANGEVILDVGYFLEG